MRRFSDEVEGIFQLAVDLVSRIEHTVAFWSCGAQAVILREILIQQGGTLDPVISDAGETEFDGVPVSSWRAFLDAGGAASEAPRFFAVAIGGESGEYRLERFGRLKEIGLELSTLVRPSATILAQAEVGEACQILARAVIGVDARLAML